MKKRLLALFLAACMILGGCAKTDVKPDTAEKDPVTPPPSPVEKAHVPLDYSDHTSEIEANYKTTLADLSDFGKGVPVFVKTEPVSDVSWRKFEGLVVKDENWGIDVCGLDISNEDLSVVKDINDLTFSNNTVWPAKLPEGFDPAQILENNKNPGLGVRDVHKSGITGAGVGIAIIDQGLLLEHEQYKDNLMSYEKIHCADNSAALHGPAVASIAVGKDIGVAPGAKLYYIAASHWHSSNNIFETDAAITADAILRILEINKTLPENEKIRVISNSKGYGPRDDGYDEFNAAVKKAEDENVVVMTVGNIGTHEAVFFGLGRDYLSDPDVPSDYLPADWVANNFYAGNDFAQGRILVPMGSRTYAGCTGTSDYEIGSSGGMSWAVPWMAGFYALCCEAKPDITPEEFIEVAKATATKTEITHSDKKYNLGLVANPAAAIAALQAK